MIVLDYVMIFFGGLFLYSVLNVMYKWENDCLNFSDKLLFWLVLPFGTFFVSSFFVFVNQGVFSSINLKTALWGNNSGGNLAYWIIGLWLLIQTCIVGGYLYLIKYEKKWLNT